MPCRTDLGQAQSYQDHVSNAISFQGIPCNAYMHSCLWLVESLFDENSNQGNRGRYF